MTKYLLFASLFAAAAATATAQSITLKDAPILVVEQNGSASAILTLQNSGLALTDKPHLSISDFKHKGPDGKEYPLKTTSTLTPVNVDGSAITISAAAPIKSGDVFGVRITVANLWEAGQSEASLMNDGASMGVLKAVRIPAAYNVQIVSPTPDAPEIHFIGEVALVGFKNSDSFNYRLAWKLALNGSLYEGGDKFIDLAPGGTTWICLGPPTKLPMARWLTAGTLKDEIIKGNLILTPVFAGDAMAQPPAPKDIPVTFRFSFWNANVEEAWNAVWIFLLLMAGGIFSIWVHYGMPNTGRALDLEKRINGLRTKVEGLGTDIDSRWRAMLESHLPALYRKLASNWWIFPSFTSTLDTLTSEADMFQQWVEIAYGVSVVLHRASQNDNLIPPTAYHCIEEKCAHALTPIESGFTTTDEIVAMKVNLKAAQDCLDMSLDSSPNPDLEKKITDREADLRLHLTGLTVAYPAFAPLIARVPPAPQPLKPADYMDRDTISLKVSFLQRFDDRKNLLAGAAAASPGALALARLNAKGPDFEKFLVPDTLESLRVAFLFVEEMRQDIYASGAPATEMAKTPPAVTIKTNPARIETHSPIMFALRFNRSLLNEASAREEWKCTWGMGDGTGSEAGWEVFHCYTAPGQKQVQITLADLDDNPVPTGAPISDTVTVNDPDVPTGTGRFWKFVRPSPEALLELARTTIFLAIAMIALMATAQQKIANLSFLGAVGAIIALGFGVDLVKNLALKNTSGNPLSAPPA